MNGPDLVEWSGIITALLQVPSLLSRDERGDWWGASSSKRRGGR